MTDQTRQSCAFDSEECAGRLAMDQVRGVIACDTHRVTPVTARTQICIGPTGDTGCGAIWPIGAPPDCCPDCGHAADLDAILTGKEQP